MVLVSLFAVLLTALAMVVVVASPLHVNLTIATGSPPEATCTAKGGREDQEYHEPHLRRVHRICTGAELDIDR
ncbi:MAG: hypothetical protein WBY94_16285 [Polyangiaceae bacterium]